MRVPTMNINDCFYLGTIAKKFSFRGEVLIHLETDEPEAYLEMESVFVAMGAELVPFFIENAQWHGAYLRVKFEEVDSEADAASLLGKKLYLPLEFLPELEGDAFYYHEIVGFEVIDQQQHIIGTIAEVMDNAMQDLLRVESPQGDILIPLVDDFIVALNREARQLHLHLPEGLIQLNH